MVWLEWVIKIGGALSALGVICGAIALVFKRIFAPYLKTLKKIEEHTFDNYLTCLRLTVMNSEMPIGERIVAAHKYIKYGGNGDVKKYAIEELHINDVQHDE